MLPTFLSSRGCHAVVRATALAAVGGLAQPAWSQGITVVPSFSIQETLTNNRDQRGGDQRGDLITQVSPGVSLNARRGVLVGSLTYSFNGLLYARDSSLNNAYHSLASTGRLTLLDGRAGVDVSANAGRQVISAYGTQSVDGRGNQANQAQVLAYSLSPYLSGLLLGEVNYQARLGLSGSRSESQATGDPMSLTGSAGLSGRLAAMGWGLELSRQSSEFEGRPRINNTRMSGSVNYSPDMEWSVTARAGTESDDNRTGLSERVATWGAGVAWTPGPRTTIRLDTDRRFFGQSHSVSLSHRMARTVWTFSDSRSLETSGLSGRAALSNYEFYSQQFAFIAEGARDALVREFLAQNNLDPSARATGAGFLSNGPTVQRSQNLSMAYQGLRATFTVTLFKTRSASASETIAAAGDLASAGVVSQRGLRTSWSHKLSTDASIVVSASLQKTPGAGALPGNELRSITATWSAKLGRAGNVTLGLRHSQFDNDVNPYQESAVIGSIRMQF